MKVICIDDKPTKNTFNPQWLHLIKEGNVYTVIDFLGDCFGGTYSLKNVHLPQGLRFAAERFIPLSNIDETQLINVNKEELV